ncbi:MAG: hypothetical protein WCT33_02180 [Patescibacteria group bacterium]|jgi:hypothetical protein
MDVNRSLEGEWYMSKQASASVDRVENLRLWVERCDDMGNVFMSIRQNASVPEGGVYICCQDGTKFFFAGNAIDFRTLNAVIAENVRDEFEMVVTGKLCQVTPEAFELLTEEHLADTVDCGKAVAPDWSEKELARMRRDFGPIHFIQAETLVVNL